MSQHKFLVVCHPGFESVCLEEILEKTSFEEGVVSTGAVELEGNLAEGFRLNSCLKTATRVLLRLGGGFRARDLPKLYKKLKKVHFRPYLWTAEGPLKVSTKSSRLIHSGKVEKTLRDALRDYFAANVVSPKLLEARQNEEQARLFLRIEDDQCVLSVDTTGEALYKRHSGKLVGQAPMRETLCASMLMILKKHSHSEILFDPMGGAGTFALEALSFNSFSERRFSYQSFPQVEALEGEKAFEKKKGSLYQKVILNDLDVSVARKNLSGWNCQFSETDFFKGNFQVSGMDAVVNPPYNKRLKINEKMFYGSLVNRLFDDLRVALLGIVLPRDRIGEIPVQYVLEKVAFRNGGFPLYFLVLRA